MKIIMHITKHVLQVMVKIYSMQIMKVMYVWKVIKEFHESQRCNYFIQYEKGYAGYQAG